MKAIVARLTVLCVVITALVASLLAPTVSAARTGPKVRFTSSP
jgi:hypothetical protein